MSLDDYFVGLPEAAPARGGLSLEIAHEESDCAVVFLRGELDRTTAPALTQQLRAMSDAGGPDRVTVVNLAGTTFIDVAGMRCLFEAAGWASEQGSRLFLAGCSAHLVRMLRLSDLFDGIDVIPLDGRDGRGRVSTP